MTKNKIFINALLIPKLKLQVVMSRTSWAGLFKSASQQGSLLRLCEKKALPRASARVKRNAKGPFTLAASHQFQAVAPLPIFQRVANAIEPMNQSAAPRPLRRKVNRTWRGGGVVRVGQPARSDDSFICMQLWIRVAASKHDYCY